MVFISGQVLQNTPSLLVKCDGQLTADVIPYNMNEGGPGAGLLSRRSAGEGYCSLNG